LRSEIAKPFITTQSAEGELDLRARKRPGEMIVQGFLLFCGAVSILTTLGIVLVLLQEALIFFRDPEVSLVEFFTTTAWQPVIGQFGIFPLFLATVLTSLIGMAVALPLGVAIAIYLSEYATPRNRSILKPILEILAGIPTVVYGFFALSFVTPILRNAIGRDVVDLFNMASAGLVIGILILPLVASMSEDALSAVPRSLREGAYGLGATRLETAVKIVVPAAMSGLGAAFIVAISRAVGETMVVAIAAGSGPRNFNSWADATNGLAMLNPFKSGETMTGHIVRISGGDLSYNSIDYTSIFAIALMLFVMTLTLNIISQSLVRRFRMRY
jgi:phosphate transport system permease protein